jgi:glucosamine-6-phosphate deaminase
MPIMRERPNAMEIFVVPDASGTGAVAAGILAAVIRSKPAAVLGVATGGSPSLSRMQALAGQRS